MKLNTTCQLALSLLVGCLWISVQVQAAEFTALGDLDGGDIYSFSMGVSANGSVVVGNGTSASGVEAFRWTASGGMVGLGDLSGGDFESRATATSTDGSIIVGTGTSDNGYEEAFRWTDNDGMVGLGRLPLGGASVPGAIYGSRAYAVSANGTIVVGRSDVAGGREAFRWTQSGGMVGLGDLPGGIASDSSARGISADGDIVIGYAESASGPEAFRWTTDGAMVGLGDLSGGVFSSGANGISADGSIIVGWGNSDDGTEAFRWTIGGGMVGLGDLPGGVFESVASTVSANGSAVVGMGSSTNGNEAFLWTVDEGMQSIQELLAADGIDMSGWQLLMASGISDDGTVIVGAGTSDGNMEAWLVRLGSGLLTTDVVAQSTATLLPTTESGHSLSRENLETHLNASRHYHGRPGASFDLYAAGFGGEWNSYTAGGTIGIAWNYSNNLRFGAGVFKSSYSENDLAFSGKYKLDSLGGTLWIGYANPDGGLQLNAVGLLASLDNEIKRGYLNGSGLDQSTGSPDGDMKGVLLRLGWKLPVGKSSSLTPFTSYSWSGVEIDAYTETGGGFPAYFDSRKDRSEVVKVGLEGETQLSKSINLWGQAAYGKRLDKKSAGISGEVIGLMDFSQPGYDLDDKWFEADLGIRWQATQNVSVMLTGGSAFGNDQNPDWRTSLGVSWAFM